MVLDVYVCLILSTYFLNNSAHVLRTDPADFFTIQGDCSVRTCLTESQGTSEMAPHNLTSELGVESNCICQCVGHLPVFREDLRICVHDIHECSLVPFVSRNIYQKVPYVYLPLKGQIVYPSAEIIFTGVKHPICVVSGANYLTMSGWVDLRNRSDYEPPFRLYVDEGRTFLQWLGESDLRVSMEGRILLINLLCKEIQVEDNSVSNIFTPCLAFRAAGVPSEASVWSGVREVSFANDNSQTTGKTIDQGYVIMAVCSVFLGVAYIAAIVAYFRGRCRMSYNSQSRSTANEEHVVKSNPLLVHCHDSLVYLHESTPSTADSDSMSVLHEDSNILTQVKVTAALVHGSRECLSGNPVEQGNESGNIECLPEEDVSITETLESGNEKSVQMVGAVNVRRKLYFNPAYFEPELLLAPPPGAVEFLTKIREVMTFAKSRMATKKFLPSLMAIPEESCLSNNLLDSNSWILDEYSTALRKVGACCGFVNSNIRKWLDNMPVTRGQYQEYVYSSKTSKAYEEKLPNDELLLEIVNETEVSTKIHVVDEQPITSKQKDDITHYEVIEVNGNAKDVLSTDNCDGDNDALSSRKSSSNQLVQSYPEKSTQNHDYEMIMFHKNNPDFTSLPNLTNLKDSEKFVTDISVRNRIYSDMNLNRCSFDSKDGFLSITVEGLQSPEDHFNSSDDIEPDTLDRKPTKFRVNEDTYVKRLINEDLYYDSLERPVITLKTSGSFSGTGMSAKTKSLSRAFGSLREIFEAKYKHECPLENINRNENLKTVKESGNDEILLPEARQAKRQRQPYPDLSVKPPTCHEKLKIDKTSVEIKLDTNNPNFPYENRSTVRPEDLGYLSTESNESRKEESQSDTDDSFYDGASESGAESTATDSFLFGKFSKLSVFKVINSEDNSVPPCSDTESNGSASKKL